MELFQKPNICFEQLYDTATKAGLAFLNYEEKISQSCEIVSSDDNLNSVL